MLYANVEGRRVSPTPGARATCPICESEVIARCGDINAWHWAHANRIDCDSWSEGESEWHRTWKQRFPRQWREHVIGMHRADIKSPRGIIELQASSISAGEVENREAFYGEMVWVLDAREFNLKVRDRGSYVTFRWKHPRKTWWHAGRPLYFDVGDRLIRITRIYDDIPCGGSGSWISYDSFGEAFSQPKPGQKLCEGCRMPFAQRDLIETGMYEYYMIDLDPGTVLCAECYEHRRVGFIPDDPSLFDAYTPVEIS